MKGGVRSVEKGRREDDEKMKGEERVVGRMERGRILLANST